MKDIRKLVSNIPEPSRQDPEDVQKAAGTPGSSQRRLTRLSSSSRDKEFPPVPRDTTWKHVLEHIEKLDVTVELVMSPTLPKDPESAAMSGSGP